LSEGGKSKEKRWTSARQLADEYVGGNKVINRKLKKLRADLISEIAEQINVPWVTAYQIVDAMLIGNPLIPGKTGPKALVATPEDIRLLELEKKSDESLKDANAPRAEQGWKSAQGLLSSREYRGAWLALDAKLRKARETLVTDVKEQLGVGEEEATEGVDRFLIGWRVSVSGGPKTLFASPSAIALLESEGTLRRRQSIGKHTGRVAGDSSSERTEGRS